MGYTTEFEGSVGISPPLNAHEIAYLRKSAASRRMDRTRGPYFVDGSGPSGRLRRRDCAAATIRAPGTLVGLSEGVAGGTSSWFR